MTEGRDDASRSGIDRGRHIELRGRTHAPWVRRMVVAAFLVVVVAALANAFGQNAVETNADSPAATLGVAAPDRVRGGLFYEGRIDVVARDGIERPTISLDEGWTKQMQLNTIEPAPASETSSSGRLELEYDPLHTGDHLTIWLQFEVNPVFEGVGRRDQDVVLRDGDRILAHVDRKLTVFP